MKIIREGKEIELTSEELASAHAEFVTNFMRKTLEEDFDVAPEDSQQLAEQAYDRYCEGNGEMMKKGGVFYHLPIWLLIRNLLV